MFSLGKRLGMTFSQLNQCSMSMFLKGNRREVVKRQRLKYEKRINTLDPDCGKDLTINKYATVNRNPKSRVHLWGQACYGALGNPAFVFPKSSERRGVKTMHTPVRCALVEMFDVKDIACGYGYTVFAVNQKYGQLMGTGINKDGQIGYHTKPGGSPLEALIRPVYIQLPDPNAKVVNVEAGRAHTLASTNSGDVYSLGNNAYGQCGRNIVENEDYFRSQIIHKIDFQSKSPDDKIVGILCGMDHSIFRTESGALFSCGWSADGQTGLGHYDNQSSPAQVGGDVKNEKIVKVACASDCVLALNDKGDVFGWGNSEYGQFRMVTEEQQINNPVKLTLKGVGKVIDVAAGGTVCIVLNENHDVFVWGYGILGKGPNLDQTMEPTLLPAPLFGRNEFNPEAVVTSIKCGLGTNSAINSGGDLYMWGKNRSSCLGLGDWKDQYFPLKVSMGAEVKKVSLGVEHTGVLGKPWV